MEYETSILLRLIASTSQDFTHTHFIHPHAFYPPTQGFFIHTSTHTLLRCLGALWDQPGPHKRSKVPPSLENGTTEDFLGSNEYGEGVCRFHVLTHLSETTRTYFPKSSRNTPPQYCGSPRTLANDPELGHLDAIWSSIHLVTSCSFQTTEREPNWICLGKVPSLMRS